MTRLTDPEPLRRDDAAEPAAVLARPHAADEIREDALREQDLKSSEVQMFSGNSHECAREAFRGQQYSRLAEGSPHPAGSE